VTSAAASKPGGAACLTCPARDGRLVAPEPAAASGGPRLVVVGEAPGRADLEEGRPFSGSSGRMLQRGLTTIGLRRRDAHWTNAILCECRVDDQKAARKACATRLQQELAAVVSGSEAAHPVVAPFGALALQSVLGRGNKPQILKWRGSVTPASFMGPSLGGQSREAGSIPAGSTAVGRAAFVLPSIHPAFVLRAPAWGPILEIDVARMGRVLEGGFVAPEEQPGRRIVVAKTLDQLRAELSTLGPELGNDVETVGLGPTTTALVCLALSDSMTTVVIPWSTGRDGRDPWWPGAADGKAAGIISECLASRISVTHNGPAFDHVVEARYGIRINRWDDTLLAQHAVAGHMPKRLQHVVSLSLDVTAWKEFEDRTATLERLWVYNARDTLYTILRWQAVKRELELAA
jgi:uracil-DNA glycosylase family 4